MGDRAGRWFHTLVVVGTAMTACGGGTTVESLPAPDGGRSGAQPMVGGTDSGSAEGAAGVGRDASPNADASPAPDATDMTAKCCMPPRGCGCLVDDAGAPVCGWQTCSTYCICIQ